MKKVLFSSYKSIHFAIASVLWTLVLAFVMAQNGFVTQIAIKSILYDSGVDIGSVRGGIFGVISIDNVAYRDALKARSVNIKIDVFALLDKKLQLDLLDCDVSSLDAQKLSKYIKKLEGKSSFDEVSIRQLRVKLPQCTFGEFVVKSADVGVKNLAFVSNRLLFEYSAILKTNIVNVKAEGLYKDMNYTAKGVLEASGDKYINKLSNDVDFDFNALKSTPFSLKGDDKTLRAEANIKDSAIFYKYGIDATVLNVNSEMLYDLSNNSFVVNSKGLVGSRFGIVDSNFEVSYKDKVAYRGSGVVQAFKEIPLGVFKNNIKIVNPKNKSVNFEGDVHKLTVHAEDVIGTALIKNEPVNIVSSKTIVDVDFDTEDTVVKVDASASSKYGDFDIATIVNQDKKGFVSFDGNVEFKKGKDTTFKAEWTKTLRAKFNGDENTLDVHLAANNMLANIHTDGYDKYDGKLNIPKCNIGDIFIVPERFENSSFAANIDGGYDYKSDSVDLNALFKSMSVLGKSAKISTVKLRKTPKELSVSPCDFQVGSLVGRLGTIQGTQNTFSLESNGLNINSQGNFTDPTKVNLSFDFDKGSEWLNELFEIRKNTLSGKASLSAEIENYFTNPKTKITLKSDAMKAFDFDTSNILLRLSYGAEKMTIDEFGFTHKLQKYEFTKVPTIIIGDNKIEIGSFAINNTLFGKAEYKNDELVANLELKNYKFYNEKLAKLVLNGYASLVRKDGKNYIDGNVVADNVELYYSPKSAKITKDRSIKVINKKAPPKVEDEFFRNTKINIQLSHNGKIVYKTKEASAQLSAYLMYNKEFEQKPGFVGLVTLLNGHYLFEGRKFQIVDGKIALINGQNDDPYVDLTLKLEERDITIFIGAKGSSSAPKLTFWSMPALGEREIMSYLIFGIDDGFGMGKSQVKSDYTTKAIGALSNILSKDVSSELGIKLDKIEISPSEYQKEGKTVNATKVEIGKRVSKDLTVIYKNDVESGVGLQYRLNKNVGIETETRTKGNSIDLFYKQDY